MQPSNTTTSNAAANVALRLPSSAFTRSGIEFCPEDDVWDWFDGPYRLYLDFGRVVLPRTIPLDALKTTLMVFMKRSSAISVANLFNTFIHYLSMRSDETPLKSISSVEVSNYSARLQDREKWRVGTLNVLLQKWFRLGLTGVDADCTQYLRELRKEGNTKGEAVRTSDPIKGPFSEQEYTSLYKAVDVAYGKGEIPQWVVVLTRLLFASGGRISQYASLKLCDVSHSRGICTIRLPLAKTRQSQQRLSFNDFDLSPQTGRLVKEYTNGLRRSGFDDNSAFFPEDIVMSVGRRTKKRDADDPFFGHCQSAYLSDIFSSHLEDLAPPSSRLDFESLPVNPRRFRYTFGTRLVEEGASKIIVADRLGHTDLQNVDVYFESSPKVIENIDKAMTVGLAPLSRVFMGRLIKDESQSTSKGSEGSRIIDFRSAPSPVGSCAGSGKNCGFNKPVACYVCFKFEPWLDAPHEKVLARLKRERDLIADERVAAINNDAILAISEVIAECELVMASKEGASKV